MIAAMISISMLTTVIENLDKGGQGDFAADVKPSPETPKATPLSAPLSPSGTVPFASNVQTPTTTYATGPMGDGTPNATYASWYRNTYLQQSPPKNTGFDTFGETPLAGSTLGDVPVVCPMVDSNNRCVPLTSGMGRPQEFGLFTRDYGTRIHAGQDYDCPQDYALRPMTQCEVKYHTSGSFICNVLNNGQKTMVTFHYVHLLAPRPFPVNTVIDPSKLVGYCSKVNATAEHLHLEIEICDNLSYSESLARMQAKYPASGVSGGVPFITGGLKNGGSTGRNCYLVHPNFFVKGAMSFAGTEAAGFSAVATNFKNFGILDVGFLLVVVICIVSLQILKQAQRFTSGQGMGIFMKALGQMITGVIQALGSMVTVGAKAAEMAAPLAGSAMGAAAGAAGQIMERTGFDKVVNRAAEGLQGAMNNVTQGLSGVMDNIGSGISGFVGQSVQAVQNLPITQRVMEFQQGMRDLAAGIASSDFAQGIARVVMPGVAVLTFATKNIAMPVAGFVGREVILPTAGFVGREVILPTAMRFVKEGAELAFDTLTDDMFKDVNFAGEWQNARENLAKAPLSEAPARDATPPAVEQQAGLVRVQNTGDVTTGERQTNPQNDYAVLGVREGATPKEMRAALRQKGRELHPDANRNLSAAEQQGLQERFKEITAAYNAVKDNITFRESQGQDTPNPSAGEGRLLSGTTFAPIPRGQTEDSRAAQDSSRRDSVAASREALGGYAGGGSYSGGYESRFREEDQEADNEPTTNESSSNTKPKTEGPANNIVSARGLSNSAKKPNLRREGEERAASIAGDGVSAHEIIAKVGYEASTAAMEAAKKQIMSERTMQASRK
jgi:curved DNA-binding protein CbpA